MKRIGWLTGVLLLAGAAMATPQALWDSSVKLRTEGGYGSGNVIAQAGDDALVLTANHVAICELTVGEHKVVKLRLSQIEDLALVKVLGYHATPLERKFADPVLAEDDEVVWSDSDGPRYSRLYVSQPLLTITANIGAMGECVGWNGVIAPGASGSLVERADGTLVGMVNAGHWAEAPEVCGRRGSVLQRFLKQCKDWLPPA